MRYLSLCLALVLCLIFVGNADANGRRGRISRGRNAAFFRGVPAFGVARVNRGFFGSSFVGVNARFGVNPFFAGCGVGSSFLGTSTFFAPAFIPPALGNSSFFLSEQRGILGARATVIQQNGGVGGSFLLSEQRGPLGGLRSRTIISNGFFQ